MAGERILLVEDERAVARGLQYGLEAEGFSVLWAADGEQALEMARNSQPQLILLDLRLPDMSGFDVCRLLRLEGLRQPVLMLTARDDPVDKVLGLELGADDYIVKPYNLRELVARIRAQLRRAYGELAQPAAGEKLVFGDVIVDLEKMQITRAGLPVQLTPTEFRLLRFMASHPERPLPRSTLLEAVWGYENTPGTDRLVDVHIRRLREKLEDDPSQPRWILTVRGAGYRFQTKS